jgi:predicted ArsR family transcriptional regulator
MDPVSRVTEALPPLFAFAAQQQQVAVVERKPLPRAVDTAARASSGRRQRIVQFLVNNGPSTLDEICAAFRVMQNQISGRFSELKRDGLIEETGLERASRSGCACQVYDVTAAGRAALKGKVL